VIFHVQHAWVLQDSAHHVLRGPSCPTVPVITTVPNTTPRGIVWLLALLDSTSLRTQPAVHVDQIVKNAPAQQLAPNAPPICTLTWVIVCPLALPIPLCRPTTLAWLAIFLAELAKTFPTNVSLVPPVTLTTPEPNDASEINLYQLAHQTNSSTD
jgi:hypothetical protein